MSNTAHLIALLYLFFASMPITGLAQSYTQAEQDEAYRIAKQRIERQREVGKLDLSDLDALNRLPPEIAEMDLIALYLGKGNETLGSRGTQVKDISALRRMRRLMILDIEDTPVSSLAPLKDLEILRDLNASGTQVSNLAPLRNKQHLEHLDLARTRISSVKPLEQLRKIEFLDISHTRVSNLSPLKGMKNLRTLFMGKTPVSDLSSLAGLNISSLSITGTEVTDLYPLAGIRSMHTLRAGALPRLDVETLEKMTQITSLWIDNNEVKNLDFLKGHSLSALHISGTLVDNLAQLSHMQNLRAIDLSQTPVEDLAPLKKCGKLWAISMNDTNLEDISPLTGLPNLSRLEMKNTKVTDLSPLRDLVGVTIIGAAAPVSQEHPERDLICASHRSGHGKVVRDMLAPEMEGPEDYYRVISLIECGKMRRSPLYLMVSDNPLSRDVDDTITEIAELDKDLRLALLNRREYRRLPLGPLRPETLLDRVEAIQEFYTDPLDARRLEQVRKRLVKLGALKFEDLR